MTTRKYGALDLFDNLSLKGAKLTKFYDSGSAHFAALKAPSSLAADYTLTLPADDGNASQVLSTDGSGVLSWVTALTTSLASGSIFVGIAGVATAVDTAAQGDVTASSAGLVIKSAAVTNAKVATGIDAVKIANGSVSNTEFQYLDGVTSAIQTQIDSLTSTIHNFEWQPSALSRSTTPPGSPASGDRYLVIATATGAWAGHEDSIAEWNGSAWVFTVPTTGTYIGIDDESDGLYLFGGSSWSKKYFEATTASTGLVKVGFDIRLDASSAGAGLGFSTGVLSVNVDNSTLEINSDTVRVKDAGITNAKVATGIDAVKIANGSVSNTEFQYLDGVTSAIQTQLDAKARGFAADWLNADGASKVITHSLGSKDILVQVFDTADDALVEVDSIIRTDTNTTTLTASQAPGTTWRVVIIRV